MVVSPSGYLVPVANRNFSSFFFCINTCIKKIHFLCFEAKLHSIQYIYMYFNILFSYSTFFFISKNLIIPWYIWGMKVKKSNFQLFVFRYENVWIVNCQEGKMYLYCLLVLMDRKMNIYISILYSVVIWTSFDRH